MGGADPRAREAASEPADDPTRDLFPAPVVCVRAGAADYESPLHPEEEAHVRAAGARRQREFRAGRASAREALRRLGAPVAALLPGPGGAPRWPAGVVGSISHCPGLCAAALAPAAEIAGLGIDAERAGRASRRVLERIAVPDELRHLAALPPGDDWATLLFAAKEALYKCVAARAAAPLRYLDVEVAFDPPTGRLHARRLCDDAALPAVLEGWFRTTPDHVAAGVVHWRANAPGSGPQGARSEP